MGTHARARVSKHTYTKVEVTRAHRYLCDAECSVQCVNIENCTFGISFFQCCLFYSVKFAFFLEGRGGGGVSGILQF